ncbi:RHS repeat domain-containing protein [Piscinibacter sp.]|uniref:RHS repeat domain-containing protein n=1 Tax=Piscinibacter sp. TaxID=1903157 RepID=UPI0039E40ADB
MLVDYADHLATLRIVLNTAGQQRWRWPAEPFGTSAPDTNPQSLGAFAFNLRFPGQYADAESGMFYNHFRDHDASTGRYAQPDPNRAARRKSIRTAMWGATLPRFQERLPALGSRYSVRA